MNTLIIDKKNKLLNTLFNQNNKLGLNGEINNKINTIIDNDDSTLEISYEERLFLMKKFDELVGEKQNFSDDIEKISIKSKIPEYNVYNNYKITYPKIVIDVLGELYDEYNLSFKELVEKNKEFENDYKYILSPEGCPINSFIQIDMTGLPKSFLELAEKGTLSREQIKFILKNRIFELENSLAMYQLLLNLFPKENKDSFLKENYIKSPKMNYDNKINDSKEYQLKMGIGYGISDYGDIFSLKMVEFLRSKGVLVSQEENLAKIKIRCKPMKETYGCYGHVSGELENKKLRSDLKSYLKNRGKYIIQEDMLQPKIINENNEVEYTYIDRIFFGIDFNSLKPNFMGGFRSLMPLDTEEAKKGRNHGNVNTCWVEIKNN